MEGWNLTRTRPATTWIEPAETFPPDPSVPISAAESNSIFKARAGSARAKSAATMTALAAAFGNKISPSPVYRVSLGGLIG